MQGCPTENGKLFGRNVVLEVALGCPDTVPAESEWKALAAGTSKTKDFSPNTTTSDADDTGGWVENIVTNADFTIGFDGEVRRRDRLDQFGYGNFVTYFVTEVSAGRQPTMWVRVETGPVEVTAYMVITALSDDGSTNDIVTFSTEFKVSDGKTVQVAKVEDEGTVAVTGVTVTPATTSVAVGATRQLTANVQPADASDKSVTWTSSDPTKFTINSNGLITGVAAGTGTATVTTNDGAKTATTAVTVTE
ncbi:Ig-like domain-containing protein [Erwinia sp. PK3-005]